MCGEAAGPWRKGGSARGPNNKLVRGGPFRNGRGHWATRARPTRGWISTLAGRAGPPFDPRAVRPWQRNGRATGLVPACVAADRRGRRNDRPRGVAQSHVRITAQLVDALTGAHLWAERFDGTLENIFDLQDSVTASVVGAIAPELLQAEIARAKRKPTERLDAYDHYLRGISVVYGMTRETNEEALRLFSKAIELDSDFAPAYARAALCYSIRKANGWMVDREQEVAESARLARRAVELGKDDAVTLSIGGMVLAYVVGDLDDGAALVDRAVRLNPNLAAAWGAAGWMKICFGAHKTAIEHATHAMRLSPLDPGLWNWQFHTALAHFFAGRYNEAASWAEASLREQPNHLGTLRVAAASNAMAGRPEKAQQLLGRLRKLDPALRISNLADTMPPWRPEDRQRWVEGLRRAGLPE
jgi:tetratricopeptide (TPR) repeat protein